MDAGFLEEVRSLGGESVIKCYQCGSCAANCPMTFQGKAFPRRTIRLVQLGLRERALSSPDMWLCYFCGDCTKTCPRDADPAGLMMALRRYLITKYDWTGFSSRFYRSKKVELLAIIAMAWITGLFIYFLHGPIVLNRTELLTFAPLEVVETAGLAIFAILASLLAMNIFRMYRFIMNTEDTKRRSISVRTYIVELVKTLPIHFFTQKRLRDCSEGSSDRKYWVYHLMFFGGYVTSFVLFMFLLRHTLTNMAFLIFNPLSIVGVAATAALLFAAAVTIYGRVKRSRPVWKYSHPTDWMYLLLLVLTVATGILTGIFRYIGIPLATYLTFSLHLMIVVPFLILEVPFAKWSHLAYRPFAIYFARLKEIEMSKPIPAVDGRIP
jgi:ferredoxin/multidrug transporter EmrE-like cation transporter